jgi:hypothetical protein
LREHCERQLNDLQEADGKATLELRARGGLQFLSGEK